jgi:hypothetical protein
VIRKPQVSMVDRDTSIRFATLEDAEAIALSRWRDRARARVAVEPKRVSKSVTDPETNVAVAVDGETCSGSGS